MRILKRAQTFWPLDHHLCRFAQLTLQFSSEHQTWGLPQHQLQLQQRRKSVKMGAGRVTTTTTMMMTRKESE